MGAMAQIHVGMAGQAGRGHDLRGFEAWTDAKQDLSTSSWG